jgi:cytochrome c553
MKDWRLDEQEDWNAFHATARAAKAATGLRQPRCTASPISTQATSWLFELVAVCDACHDRANAPQPQSLF